ncbi:unnamed protein product [Gongylonema pulchrum]|uniref:7TM_GPCR_Srx domain-containing protein n=1 Tax=Gongylonema pulchrum TaxID=637853 RepID=A0A183EBB1_9BILA|nr:unnamed protein product [Gongylonema pulchrum]
MLTVRISFWLKCSVRNYRICERHLELEPLCCLSSCLVRGGCTAVAAFEYTYIVITVIAIILRLHESGQFRFWSQFKLSYNLIVTHKAFLYVLLGYDLVSFFNM